MRLLLIIISFFLCQIALTQTKSDSLYQTKFYPLSNGNFLLIGSESPVSFRKSYIRLYDKDLNLIEEKYKKHIRISDMYAELDYPNNYRIISRYRWNKGHVYLFDEDLNLKSDKFFKRDAFKDYQEEIQDKNSPLNKEDNYFGLQPVVYSDSLYFQFNRETKTLSIGRYDISKINPSYDVITSIKVLENEEIDNFKIKIISNRKWILYYAYTKDAKRTNCFCFYELTNGSIESIKSYTVRPIRDHRQYYISDFNYFHEKELLVFSGSYCAFDFNLTNDFPENNKRGMDGFFVDGLYFNSDKLNFEKVFLNAEIENDKSDTSKMFGYKVNSIEIENDIINVSAEKIQIQLKFINRKATTDLADSYHTYTSISLNNLKFNLNDKDFISERINLKFNLFTDKEFLDKQWRTFRTSKGQGIQNLIFNGESNSSFNLTSIVYNDVVNKKTVYSDRNNNYYLCNWSQEDIKYSLLEKGSANQKLFFYENYFIKYSILDFGYKLEKISY